MHVAKSRLDGSVSTGGGTVKFDDVTGDIVGSSGSSGSRRLGSNAYYFRMPDMKEVRIPRIDMSALEGSREAIERSNRAMERSNEAMKMSQKELWRVQKKMADDSEFMNMDSTMANARIMIERNGNDMDSARIMIERHRGEMDSDRARMERDRDDSWRGYDESMGDRGYERHNPR